MGRINRRAALAIMGSATGAMLCPLPAWSGSRPAGTAESLAERIRTTPSDTIFDLAVKMIGEGVTYRDMLAAIFLAGLQDIRPRHVGGKLHAVMMVASAFELAERTDRKGAWQITLWNLDDFKHSQQLDREGGDWQLGPQPEISLSREKAKAELATAMENWDDAHADRAIVALLPHLAHEEMFEVLWPLAARCYENIGHKIIYASQLERTLRRIGWRHATPALRSLIHGLLFVGRRGPRTEAFASSRGLVNTLPANWREGKLDPHQSVVLLRSLRQSSSTAAQQLVVEALTSGLAPASVWDGLRLYAAELFLQRLKTDTPAQREALLPVHAVTVTHALGHAWRTTKNERTQKLMLLQAAAYLPLLRRDLRRIVGLRDDAEGLDVLGDTTANPGQGAIFSQLTPAQAQNFLNPNPDQAAAYMNHLRTALIAGALEHHQYKLAAAIQEEHTQVHPNYATRMLTPAAGYLAETGTPSERMQRTRHALLRAGI